MDANKLQDIIMKNGFTITDISNLLGISVVSTHRKLTGISNLTIGEAVILKNALELSDKEASIIFLGA